MAARIDRIHSERVRQRIRVSQLVTRLQNHALGRNKVEMTSTQIDAAKFIVNKAMGNPPELKELSGPDGGAIALEATVRFVKADAEA